MKPSDKPKACATGYYPRDSSETVTIDFREAEMMGQEADDISQQGERDATMARIKVLRKAKDLLQAALRQLASLPGDHTDMTLLGMQHLANVLDDLDEVGECRILRSRIVQMKKKTLGVDHIETFQVTRNLAVWHLKHNNIFIAEQELQDLLSHEYRSLTSQHPEWLKALRDLTQVYDKKTELLRASAQEVWRSIKRLEAVELQQQELATYFDPKTPKSPEMSSLGAQYDGLSARIAALESKSLALRREVIRDMTNALGELHPALLDHMSDTANVLLEAHRFHDEGVHLIKEALRLQVEVVERRETLLGPQHVDVLAAKDLEVAILLEAKDLDAAVALEKDLFELKQAKYGFRSRQALSAMHSLAETLYLRETTRKLGINLMKECYDLSVVYLDAEDKDTQARFGVLQAWKVNLDLSISESSSRKSAPFLENYRRGLGRDVTYGTARFTPGTVDMHQDMWTGSSTGVNDRLGTSRRPGWGMGRKSDVGIGFSLI